MVVLVQKRDENGSSLVLLRRDLEDLADVKLPAWLAILSISRGWPVSSLVAPTLSLSMSGLLSSLLLLKVWK